MTGSWSSSDLHLDWDPGSGRRGLAEALRLAIRVGRLAPGTPLPSTRALAADLGIARGTVTRVYNDLAVEGYLRSRQGAPTRVAARTHTPAEPHEMPGPPTSAWFRDARWDLFPGRPDLSSFPRAAWASAARRTLHSMPARAFDYGDPAGPAVLREALARYLARSRGVLAEPDRIVVCGGYSQAITVLGHLFDEIAFEDPSLPEFREAAGRAGAKIVPVPVDDDGIVVSELDSPVAVATPAHQYPLGVTLAPERRSALAGWTAAGGLLIEDDYDGEFRFDRQPVGAVQSLAPDGIVYAGGVSKTLSPALRIGWLVLPRRLVGPVREVMFSLGWRTPVLDHLILADLLRSGAYDRHVRQRRTAYRRRRDRLLAALPPGFAPEGISAGLHLVLRVPDETAALRALRQRSVAVDHLSRYWSTSGPGGLVIGYATPAEHAFGPAVEALVDGLLRAVAP
ncbi:MocR-like pyridoxine biosynthesis transcription factor PdxR [Amycolatopsis thermophila]|uniref:GntR family transcriptional regulator/MocR family aminotransferase n=1 Tax=Amycolatopsis thermophila TaxID=206084 RepID=A0ABU0EW36_9PSEU|nr:PLP-dependent aminotransferase family protein [Amycolatopsis thermophila]MDQ0379515.1 GntR family transcriptional regulator/MocR family aminotransferase [Amycolatopsis thermophila]